MPAASTAASLPLKMDVLIVFYGTWWSGEWKVEYIHNTKLNLMTNHRMLAGGWQRVVSSNGSATGWKRWDIFNLLEVRFPELRAGHVIAALQPRAARRTPQLVKPHVTVGKNDIS